MLWWLSHGEGMVAVTWCGWDKLWKGRNYWTSRLSCQVYGLRGVSWWLCVRFTWLDMTTPPWCRAKVYYYIIIIISWRKPFDTVSHNILLNKLFLCGRRGLPLSLLRSYQNNRTHCVMLVSLFREQNHQYWRSPWFHPGSPPVPILC